MEFDIWIKLIIGFIPLTSLLIVDIINHKRTK